jgi:hypothetical protein
MRTLLVCLQIILLSSAWSFAAAKAEETGVIKLARELRIPKVEFREATLSEAIAFLMQKSKTADPKEKGINIAVAGQISPEMRLTFSLTDASLYDILQVVAGQAGLELQPGETVIMLVPKARP